MANDLKGPMMAANVQRVMETGVRQRYAVSVAGMREPQPKQRQK